MIKSEFSTRLAELLARTGDSMRDLAQKSGIPYSTIRGYIAGDSLPTGIEQLHKIARVTGVQPAWLLGGDVEPSTRDMRVTKELKLLVTLAEHLSDVQRGILLKQTLAALIDETDYVERDQEHTKLLSPSIIELALKLDKLSDDKRKFLFDFLDNDKK
ncbi:MULTISPECIES: helix-turn-helix domain-containing protein [Klebsiella]|nr:MULTISPECIES: helix-turn-helix transcriptional regulator [Klebsiella]MBE0135189.1 helix-turn-helix transcriptional regulator [Klebsiella michiganensis]MBE0201293.1 helix-turn-helix transcriptional regulator [Klebsiella michiganensis]MBZ7440506.1 helix-turn-helix transcriptional regulator [Klebsiella michiganensis]MBZ7496166.1 helix-turn-helix transcriptional regulator [Klebsiella michiganensis]MDL4452902.1 helix-turn-helix transcriptional regulator [Klebsiella michiganensis]